MISADLPVASRVLDYRQSPKPASRQNCSPSTKAAKEQGSKAAGQQGSKVAGIQDLAVDFKILHLTSYLSLNRGHGSLPKGSTGRQTSSSPNPENPANLLKSVLPPAQDCTIANFGSPGYPSALQLPQKACMEHPR